MQEIRSVCVFCGASNNAPQQHLDAAEEVGRMIAQRGFRLVYGAGDCGLMGKVANGALNTGGKVLGVFPRVLDGLEEEHKHLTETIVVDDMHTRKMTMFTRSDAFIVLPGGFGTMDETFEVITWKQLHTHNKPIVICNYKGYFDHWIAMTDHFINEGFAGKNTRAMYDVVDNLEGIFDKIAFERESV